MSIPLLCYFFGIFNLHVWISRIYCRGSKKVRKNKIEKEKKSHWKQTEPPAVIIPSLNLFEAHEHVMLSFKTDSSIRNDWTLWNRILRDPLMTEIRLKLRFLGVTYSILTQKTEFSFRFFLFWSKHRWQRFVELEKLTSPSRCLLRRLCKDK